ncbi:MAG: UDP-glucose/GDP-mannose dehydrogenase family protein [Protaetiibacter sp.]
MRISVIGCGYLGAVHAAAMAELGHEVVGVDVDASRVEALARGEAPFFEPGLTELLQRGLASGRLAFSGDISYAWGSELHFIAVGTPSRPDGAAELGYVRSAASALLPVLRPGDVVVGKSTVPVGTASALASAIVSRGALLAWNPEFLREGHAIRDTLQPDRLVYGVRAGEERAAAVLDAVYAPLLAAGVPRQVTDFATAELVKVAANAFLATKISFINAMAEIAEVVGADVTQLADAIGRDPRIGRRFLGAGVGFGGGCLPKDIRAFVARADELGVGDAVGFLREVEAVNLRRRSRVVDLVREAVGGSMVGRRVAVLGLAFKPDSDDVRDSPALEVARRLAREGAEVVVTDPKAIPSARRIAPELDYRLRVDDAVAGAEAVVLLTEWQEYRDLDAVALAARVRRPVLVDGRNCVETGDWVAAGWRILAPGRPAVGAVPRPELTLR